MNWQAIVKVSSMALRAPVGTSTSHVRATDVSASVLAPTHWACAPLNGVDKFADGIIAKRIIELGKAGERNRDLLC